MRPPISILGIAGLTFSCLASQSSLATYRHEPASPTASQTNAASTLRLETLDVKTTRRNLRSIAVRVRNLTSQTQVGIMGYVLALPQEPDPWTSSTYASPERAIQVPGNGSTTVILRGPGQELDGELRLSVWLHGRNMSTGQRFHSDSRSHEALIRFAPPFSFSVEHIASLGDDDGEGFELLLRFLVRNNGSKGANVGLAYTLDRAGSGANPTMGEFVRQIRLAPGMDYVVTVPHEQALAAGSYQLDAWLSEIIRRGQGYRAQVNQTFELRH